MNRVFIYVAISPWICRERDKWWSLSLDKTNKQKTEKTTLLPKKTPTFLSSPKLSAGKEMNCMKTQR